MANLQNLPPVDKLQATRQRRALVALSKTRQKTSNAARRAHGPQNPSDLQYRADLKKIVRETWDMIVAELAPDLHKDAASNGLRFKLYDVVQAKVPPAASKQAKYVSKKGLEDTKRILGIDPRIDPGVAPQLDVFVGENVRLITKLVEAQYNDAHEVIQQNLGLRHEELAGILEDRLGVSESRAALIARDQTLKLAGDLTRIRQTNAGIESFVWTTSNDERVREEHAELDGETFTWAAGAPIEGHPGQPIQCRCTAYPIVPGFEDE